MRINYAKAMKMAADERKLYGSRDYVQQGRLIGVDSAHHWGPWRPTHYGPVKVSQCAACGVKRYSGKRGPITHGDGASAPCKNGKD